MDITCLGCGILVVWDVWELGCSRCGVLCAVWNVVWDAWDVKCLVCETFNMCDVWDAGC